MIAKYVDQKKLDPVNYKVTMLSDLSQIDTYHTQNLFFYG